MASFINFNGKVIDEFEMEYLPVNNNKMSDFKLQVISFVKSFLANFGGILIIALSQIPAATWDNPQTWKLSFFVGIVLAAIRSALSKTWEKTMPVSIGGVPKRK